MSGITKRVFLALALTAFALPARADTYPNKSITIMPLLAAGTGLDIAVRLYGEELSKSLGKPVVIENKPGAAGLLRRRPREPDQRSRADGRALQAAPQKAWSGKSENVAAGQRAFAHRAHMNSLAALGQWKQDLEKKAA